MKNLLRGAFPGNSVLSIETLRRARTRSKLYVIFLTPRSGSTWLTELALNSGELGCPQEWFNDEWIYSDELHLGCAPPRLRGISDVSAYIDSIVDEGQGTAGIELSVYQAMMLRELLDEPFDPTLLNASFYLRRKDKAAQAISLYRSVLSGYWHSYQSDPGQLLSFKSTQYDFDEILKWRRHIDEIEARFDKLFYACGFDPIRIYYEELCRDPLGILNRICVALGKQPLRELPRSSLGILRDAISTDWEERFARELRALGDDDPSAKE
jgi:trehalose 2-sulfotransferase